MTTTNTNSLAVPVFCRDLDHEVMVETTQPFPMDKEEATVEILVAIETSTTTEASITTETLMTAEVLTTTEASTITEALRITAKIVEDE